MLRVRRHELGAGIEDALVDASNPTWRKYTQPIADLADTILPGRAASQFFDAYYPVVGAIGSLLGGKSEEQRKAERTAERAKRAREEEEYVAASNKRGAAEHAAREARLEKNKPGPSTVSGDASFFYGGALGFKGRDEEGLDFINDPPSVEQLFGRSRNPYYDKKNLMSSHVAETKLGRAFDKFKRLVDYLQVDSFEEEEKERWQTALHHYDFFIDTTVKRDEQKGSFRIIQNWRKLVIDTL